MKVFDAERECCLPKDLKEIEGSPPIADCLLTKAKKYLFCPHCGTHWYQFLGLSHQKMGLAFGTKLVRLPKPWETAPKEKEQPVS